MTGVCCADLIMLEHVREFQILKELCFSEMWVSCDFSLWREGVSSLCLCWGGGSRTGWERERKNRTGG